VRLGRLAAWRRWELILPLLNIVEDDDELFGVVLGGWSEPLFLN